MVRAHLAGPVVFAWPHILTTSLSSNFEGMSIAQSAADSLRIEHKRNFASCVIHDGAFEMQEIETILSPW